LKIIVLAISAPPFGCFLWEGVEERCTKSGLIFHTIDCAGTLLKDGSPETMANKVAQAVAEAQHPVLLLAHGTGVPVAIMASHLTAPMGMVLSNGPMHSTHSAYRMLSWCSQWPKLLALGPLRPFFWHNWMGSSVGLRRLVVNPYVMDRDTTVALLAPAIRTPPLRKQTATFLKHLPKSVEQAPPIQAPTLLAWGDNDPLTKNVFVNSIANKSDWISHISIAGGQHLHPIERPWALADIVADFGAKIGHTHPITT